MKYRVIIHQQEPLDLTVVGENGEVATFRFEDGHGISDYYYAKIDHNTDSLKVWEELSNQAYNIQYREWRHEPTMEQIITDALDWIGPLVPNDQWEQDDTIWANINF